MATAPEIFLAHSREDQTVARRCAESFEREAYAQSTERVLHDVRTVENIAICRQSWLGTPREPNAV